MLELTHARVFCVRDEQKILLEEPFSKDNNIVDIDDVGLSNIGSNDKDNVVGLNDIEPNKRGGGVGNSGV